MNPQEAGPVEPGGMPLPEDGMPLPEDMGRWARARERARRHVSWARNDGLARVIEEDGLDPRRRATTAWQKYRWRRMHSVQPGQAQAVFLVGVQRSGTNMIVHGLEAASSVEVHNENDRRVFSRYQLRSDEVVRDVVLSCRHQVVLFKPLSDSHNIVHLLDGLELPTPPRAVWAYRNVDDRVRSAVSKFGDVNRRVLADIASGQGSERWQAQGLDEGALEFIRSCNPGSLTPESAAALFWLVRNNLFFSLELDRREDVHLASYEQMVADPVGAMRPLAAFVGLPYSEALVAHVDQRSLRDRPRLNLDPRVRDACDALTDRLDAIATLHLKRTG